ncbi:hypothetical protein GGG16DRAFT_36911, partial [Schizophyllum commune]
MRYIVTSDGRTGSHVLSSNSGVLAGDSFSPTLFDFYFGDLTLCDRPGDVILGDKRVKNIEQADDGNLFTHLMPAMQERLTEFVEYAERKDLHTNVAKTDAVAFNHRRGPLPPLRIYDRDLCWKAEAISVGVLFCA